MSEKTRIAIFGSEGRMGQSLCEQVQKNENLVLAAKWDRSSDEKEFKKTKVDVVIDFSSPEGTEKISRFCAENKVPLVSGTTGLSPKQSETLQSLGKLTKVFFSPNMSPGLNGLALALLTFLETFQSGEIAVEEIHHKNKKDAPSGTAKLLLESIKNGASKNVKVQAPVSIRGGDLFGVHKVMFFAEGEWLSFEHHAVSRLVFARGAILAAEWLVGQSVGYYGMKDYLKDLAQ